MNNKGSAILIALMVLVVLTMTGILSSKIAVHELKSAAKFQYKTMGFYAAEAGISHAVVNATDLALADSLPEPATYLGFVSGDLGQLTTYSADLMILDGYDPDSGAHDIRIKSKGQQVKGIYSIVETEFEFVPAFPFPKGALWVDDGATISGNATIDGHYNLECDPVPDILRDTTTQLINVNGSADFGDDTGNPAGPLDWDVSTNAFIPSAAKANLIPIADHVGAWDANVKFMVDSSCPDNPVVIIIEGDLTLNNSKMNGEGCGILFIDGELQTNGNITWNGPVMASGAAIVANGTCRINGALITGDVPEVQVNGSAEIYYDCEALNSLYNSKSRYQMKWWRLVRSKLTVLPSGAIVRR